MGRLKIFWSILNMELDNRVLNPLFKFFKEPFVLNTFRDKVLYLVSLIIFLIVVIKGLIALGGRIW